MRTPAPQRWTWDATRVWKRMYCGHRQNPTFRERGRSPQPGPLHVTTDLTRTTGDTASVWWGAQGNPTRSARSSCDPETVLKISLVISQSLPETAMRQFCKPGRMVDMNTDSTKCRAGRGAAGAPALLEGSCSLESPVGGAPEETQGPADPTGAPTGACAVIVERTTFYALRPQ